ncbi:MAG: efflux RND transporter periplasmic adaptor subunit [Rhodocyclaceae bacterium]|nr:efflux RND transporter periplasmic adaptor subunit [Rhodocyclaceae bacterium]
MKPPLPPPCFLAGLALTLSALLTGCGAKDEAPPPPRPVLSQVVGPAAQPVIATYSGEVRARYETALAFRVPGKIIARRVDLGTRVKPGQELLRLDPGDQALSAAGADAQLAAATAERSLARSDLERYRGLKEKGFISQAAFEARKTGFEAAEARVAALEAQARLSRNQAAYTVLRADQAGVISQVAAESGQVVAAGQPVLRLAREEEKEVAISIPESRMAELAHVGRTEVVLWARNAASRLFEGRLREVAPIADPVTRTYPVRVSIEGADPSILLGMTANVSFLSRGTAPSITLPLTAIFQQEGKPAVWVVGKDNRLALRPVNLDSFGEDGAHIADGLKAGERVVIAGVHKLIQGERVTLLPETAK